MLFSIPQTRTNRFLSFGFGGSGSNGSGGSGNFLFDIIRVSTADVCSFDRL